MTDIFESLRPFVWPRFREEGPPEFVQGILLGKNLLGEMPGLDPAARSVLELATLGYRPVTSLAILSILSESPVHGMHGMQLARELEKRFNVQDGWFTRSRYYSDRVGKLLAILSRLEMITEVSKRDLKGGRSFTAYQISSSMVEPVKERMSALSKGDSISYFSDHSGAIISPETVQTGKTKECLNCKLLVTSVNALFCERCGNALRIICQKCNKRVDAAFSYCVNCGTLLTD